MINNANYDKKTAKRIPVETVKIFEADINGYAYSHCPYITFFNGEFIAAWTVNFLHEEENGQSIMLSYSKDGSVWSKGEVIAPFPSLAKGIIAPGGFYVNGDTLNLYVHYYEWEQEVAEGEKRKSFAHKNTKMFCVTSQDGHTFSEPIDMGIDAHLVLPPRMTSVGKMIGGAMFSFATSEETDGIHGFVRTSYLPDHVFLKYADHSQTVYSVGRHVGMGVHLMEAALLDDGKGHLKMLLRSRDNSKFVQLENELWTRETSDNLYATDSTDGVNWSKVYRTDFTNNDSKFNAGRLADGRYYITSNPDRLGLRLPLVLSLSDDGENFDRHYIIREDFNNIKFMGRWKQYGCQYPSTFEKHGYLYVIYSICKEDVAVSKIRISDLT